MDKITAPNAQQMYFLGFKEKEDDYEITDEKTGRVNKGHYHNIIISMSEPYAVSEKARVGSIGQEANTYKIKYENACPVFGITDGAFNPLIFNEWFLQPVEVLYDKYGSIKSIRRITSSHTVTKSES